MGFGRPDPRLPGRAALLHPLRFDDAVALKRNAAQHMGLLALTDTELAGLGPLGLGFTSSSHHARSKKRARKDESRI